jgi:hypothetical protein
MGCDPKAGGHRLKHRVGRQLEVEPPAPGRTDIRILRRPAIVPCDLAVVAEDALAVHVGVEDLDAKLLRRVDGEWQLTEASLFLPLAFNTRLEAATLVCPLPLVRPSQVYLRLFASLFGGYTLNMVYCTPENFKRYQTKLKSQELLKESFYDLPEPDSNEIALPTRRHLPLLNLGSFKDEETQRLLGSLFLTSLEQAAFSRSDAFLI